MNSFVLSPNIPQGKVEKAVASRQYPEIANAFKNLGITLFFVKPDKSLQTPVRQHADMLCHYLGEGRVLLARGQAELYNELSKAGFTAEFIDETLSPEYPHDIPLNCLRIGNKMFMNVKFASKSIVEYCKSNKIEIVNVNQGYTRCSTAVVNENAVITQDRGMARAFEENGIRVLLINAENIVLEGYDNGFIGGACTLVDRNKLAFFGDIDTLDDGKRIKAFLEECGCSYISLIKGRLIDIGSAIPLEVK
ncbi:MAG: hypothetical protein K5917_04100 [Clostridiales bacterium]|nr:hypothetical protein [Clostridiales bacterium]